MTEKCIDRVKPALDRKLKTLRLLWAANSQEVCEDCDGKGNNNQACKYCVNGFVTSYSPSMRTTTQRNCVRCNGSGIQSIAGCETCNNLGKMGDEGGNHHQEGSLNDYGLSFDYVTPGTFNNQKEGYFRYQISWGGPSEEFRIYAQGNEYNWSIYRIEFWFLDWFDGAPITMYGDDLEFMENLLTSFFVEYGSFDYAYNQAMEN